MVTWNPMAVDELTLLLNRKAGCIPQSLCEGRPRPFDCRTCLAILCRASWHYNTGVHITIQRESRMISCTQIRKVRPNIWLLSLRTFLQGVGTCPQVELALKLRQTTPTTCCIN